MFAKVAHLHLEGVSLKVEFTVIVVRPCCKSFTNTLQVSMLVIRKRLIYRAKP